MRSGWKKIMAMMAIIVSAFSVGAVTLAAYAKTVLIQHNGSDLMIESNYSVVTVDFVVNYDTTDGYSMYIYNDLGTVGDTTYPEYLPMYWNAGNDWKYTLNLPVNTTFEFKYVKASTADPEVNQTFELGGDKVLMRKHVASDPATINIGWNKCKAYFEADVDTGSGKSLFLLGPWNDELKTTEYRLTWGEGNVWTGTYQFDYSQDGAWYKYYKADTNNPSSNFLLENYVARTLNFNSYAFESHIDHPTFS